MSAAPAADPGMAQAILDAAPDAMVAVDEQGRITLVNTRAVELFGYAREEMLGQAVEMLVPEDGRRRHGMERGGFQASPRLRAMGNGLDLAARRKDGTLFPVDIMLSPLPTSAGPWVISAIRDTTERRRAEESVRQQSEILRRVLDINQNLIFVKDRDSRILMANEATARFYGLTVADVLGRRQDELHLERGGDPEDLHKWLADDRSVLDSGQRREWIETGRDREGRARHFQTRKYPITFRPGVPAVLVVSVDITERTEAGACSRRSVELARRVVAAAQDLREVAPRYERLAALARQLAATPEQVEAVQAADAPVREHLEARLRDLVFALEALPEPPALPRSKDEGQRAETREFRRALEETIDVLRQTKRTFKSKVLGQLRERIERLVSQPSDANGHPPLGRVGVDQFPR